MSMLSNFYSISVISVPVMKSSMKLLVNFVFENYYKIIHIVQKVNGDGTS